jgi:hypothetical protein
VNCQSRGKLTTDFWQFTQKNKMASVGCPLNCCVTIGILQTSQPNVPRDFAQYATPGEVEAESNFFNFLINKRIQSKKKKPSHCQIWRTSFYIDEFDTVQTVVLRCAIFKGIVSRDGLSTESIGV